VVTRAGTLWRPRLTRDKDLVVFEVPGFGLGRAGALPFFACAIPLGLLWGRRASAFLAVQLTSPTTAAAVCSTILGRPYLATTTTSGALGETAYVLGTRFARLRRSLLHRASFLICQTPAVAEELSALVPPERLLVLPNPVAAVNPPPLTGSPVAIFTGRFSEEKDLLRLVESWRSIATERSDARLLLVGEGGSYRSVEGRLRRQVAADPVLRRSVVFTGWVRDVGPYLAQADVFVLPSVSEGMSNALLEACAWRRVVVASDIAANRAVLGDAYPLLFPVGDTEALARVLRRALEHTDARLDALLHIEERMARFSAEAVLDGLEGAIDEATRVTSPLGGGTPRA